MLPRCALADLGLCVAWGQGDRQTPGLHHHADTVLERYRSGSRLHHRMEKPGTSVFLPPCQFLHRTCGCELTGPMTVCPRPC